MAIRNGRTLRLRGRAVQRLQVEGVGISTVRSGNKGVSNLEMAVFEANRENANRIQIKDAKAILSTMDSS